MPPPCYPALFQVNTRVRLSELAATLGRKATLDDIPDAELHRLAADGFDFVWLLGVWQTGEAARRVSRSKPEWLAEYRHVLPDFREDHVTGSCFAVRDYRVHEDFGGDKALARLRARLKRRGLRLILDFVPNHMAPDHPWVTEHPDFFVSGTEEQLAAQPQNYCRVGQGPGARILAYGRDPYFDGWPDTFQLNYRHAGFREARLAELGSIAERCDGVRCDMAMLLQPEIIQRTWADRALPSDGSPPKDNPFWNEAIPAIKRRHPGFTFVAEVYWDMEWELQQAGFDYTYDKRLYDRLVAQVATPVREHLMADPSFQKHSMRFLENHDEPRAATAFPKPVEEAAAVVALLSRGMRFIYEGQLEGRKVHPSMHVGRRPAEPVDEELRAFYARLLECMKRPEVHEGQWRLETCRPAWRGSGTWQQFIVSSWQAGERRLLSVVNYAGVQGQCYVTLDLEGLRGRNFTLVDLLGDARYERHGDGLASTNAGLYLELPAWGRQIFELLPS
jgi:hypothetical protein